MSGKPEIVVMDTGGYHNADLGASAARVIEGGSWKKQRIIMLIPAGRMVPARAALSWMNLIFPPNQGVVRWLCQNMEVGHAYSYAVEEILAHPELSQWEYVLTLEHDNIPPADGVVKLVQRMEQHPEYSCIGALYWTKGEGGVPQIWGSVADAVTNFRPQPPDPNGGLVECCGTGCGFNLWRVSMFKDARIERPLFHTLTGLEGRGVATQDLSLWTKARKLGYRCAIDCSVRCGHLEIETDTVW